MTRSSMRRGLRRSCSITNTRSRPSCGTPRSRSGCARGVGRRRAGLAEARRKVFDSPDRTAWLGVVAALPAVARGDAAAVVRALEPWPSSRRARDSTSRASGPGRTCTRTDSSASSATREADRFLARHEAVAAARGRHSAIAKLARVRGRWHVLRGEAELAERSFAAALDHIAAVQMPYEEALSASPTARSCAAAGAAAWRPTSCKPAATCSWDWRPCRARTLRARAAGVRGLAGQCGRARAPTG